MSIICIAKGTATIGLTTRGADGQIISQTPARWEHDPDGGCVALWTMNPETEEQEAPARIYGDWQASEYLGNALAASLRAHNKDGRGAEDADELMADIMLACMALHHVAEFATDKCRFVPLPGKNGG